MMSNRRGFLAMTILRWALLPLCLWLSAASAHQDPCHRLHVCSSDHNTYVWGDKGRCDQCPDYPYCLADKPRVASSPAPRSSANKSIAGHDHHAVCGDRVLYIQRELYRRHCASPWRRQAHDSGAGL